MTTVRRTTALALAVFILAACSDSDDSFVGTELPPEPPPEPPAPMLAQESFSIPSSAQPEGTPDGSGDGSAPLSDSLVAQFGPDGPDLNRALYTRYYLSTQATVQPDAILVLVPGFEGGASNMAILADNLMQRALEEASLTLEVWAIDRRSNGLEDRVGLQIAAQESDPDIGLDFLFGDILGMELSEQLDRRVIYHDPAAATAFMARWTPLVHSLDIDAVVERAREAALNNNVFLGGHSAGTGYTARYAATDLNITGSGTPDPGFAKLRGLVLLEGGGSGLANEPADAETLDRIEARFDGGLEGAVRDQAPRCIDGLTACTVATELDDCAAFSNRSCTEPTSAYATSTLLPTPLFASAELVTLDADLNGDTGLSILQQDQAGIPGNNAVEQSPDLIGIRVLLGGEPGTSTSLFGQFIDDDGPAAAIAPFLAVSVGALGPVVDGVTTWLGIDDDLPEDQFTDNGPPPTSPARGPVWGVEVEPTDLQDGIIPIAYRGDTNFFDWYYPSSGLTVTSGLGLDTTALSAPPPEGRGRSDIDNRTQARNIDIPVIGFGGSNGLTPTPGTFVAFAEAIAPCTAPACDGMTPRIVDSTQPSEAFPTFGDAAGGYEVFMSEGYAHLDILTARDREDNQVIGPLLEFIRRHSE